MTISAQAYFEKWRGDRKKEPRYLAVIDRDSCTSCNACATVCPVDCIYEVRSARPAQSYHAIDTARCIGCQLCYRIPSASTSHYTLEVCPWNAIDLLHNPNLNGDAALEPYYLGEETLPWEKLDEYAFQLCTNREVRIPAGAAELKTLLDHFSQPVWGRSDDRRAITDPPQVDDTGSDAVKYRTTEEGQQLLDFLFHDYPRLFLD